MKNLRNYTKLEPTTPPPKGDNTVATPPPEVLKPRVEDNADITPAPEATTTPVAEGGKRRHRTYRPSHKATFIALGVVAAILVVNAVILGIVLKNKSDTDNSAKGKVTISEEALSKIGVNTTTIGNSGVELVIDPDAKFNGKVLVAGDVDISGQFTLNNRLNSSEAGIAKLEAGNTSLEQLNVNGDSSLSALALRSGLTVAGSTQLQGAVTISQLLTVNNNLTVLGNLAVGGVLSTATFSANSLTSTSTLTIGGHIITGGPAPGVGPGGALGSNGTVSISGNDASGRLNINIGTGAVAGTVVNVAFRSQYGSVPRVVISPVGVGATFYITNLTTSGFSVAVTSGLPIGGYAINYIAMQ